MRRLFMIAALAVLGVIAMTPLYAQGDSEVYTAAYTEAYSRIYNEIGAAPNDNSCRDANDGACDDGGAESDYDICDLGTDAADCGIRSATEIARFRATAADAYAAPFAELIDAGHADAYAHVYARVYALLALTPNDNTCSDANDGTCDDGGPGSDFGFCRLGTDTADCGIRSVTENTPIYAHAYARAINNGQSDPYATVYAELIVAGETEAYAEIYAAAFHAVIAEGRAVPYAREYAKAYTAAYIEFYDEAIAEGKSITDATAVAVRAAVVELTKVPNDNTCSDANDGFCDDGGAGSLFGICRLGTDLTDCGPR